MTASYTIENIDVLLQEPTEGFILDISTLGETLDEPTAGDWIPVKWAGLASIDINRGGISAGLSGYGPGTATIVLVNRTAALNFKENPLFVPGTPVKIVDTATGHTLYTGRFSDLVFDYRPMSRETVLTVSCVDHIATLQNHTLYGMRPPSGDPWLPGSETYQARINRIANRTPVPFGAIPGRPPAIPHSLEVFSYRLAPGTPAGQYDVGYDETSDDGFTGYVKTTPTSPTSGGGSWASFAMDLYGPGVGRYVIQADLIRPAGSTGPMWLVEMYDGGQRNGLAVVSTWEDVEGGEQRGRVRLEFKAGYAFEASNNLRFSVEWGADRPHPNTLTWLRVENITLHEASSADAFLSATVYESSALNHLTMAADTVGGLWYVSKDNRVEVTWGESPDDPAGYWFTDDKPGRIPYGDLVTTYSTSTLVNRLDFTNHSMHAERDPELVEDGPEPGSARDVTHEAVDSRSMVYNGPREMALDTNIFYIDEDDLRAKLNRRAREIFETRSTMQYVPASLRFRATDYPDEAGRLELTQIVKVDQEADTHSARVIGISHTITPGDWITGVTLQPVTDREAAK